MILVVGGMGRVGGRICRKLVAREEKVRTLVRTTSDPARVAELKALGVETVPGDVRDRASLEAACRDVSGVIVAITAVGPSYQPGVNDIETVDHDGMFTLIDAAVGAGVGRFVYISASGGMELSCPMVDAKRAVEAYLKASSLAYTILRPACFMEVWLEPAAGFDAANARATIFGTGENALSWISVDDVAEYAVQSLVVPAARDAVLELGGPQPLTPLDVVHLYEALGRRRFELQFVPEEALVAQEAAATDPMQRSFATLMRAYAHGDPIEMGKLTTTFPFHRTSVKEYAEATVARIHVPA